MAQIKVFKCLVLVGITFLVFQQSFCQSTKFSVLEIESMLKSKVEDVKTIIEKKGYKFNIISKSTGDLNSFNAAKTEVLFSFGFLENKATITFFSQTKEQSDELVRKLKTAKYKLSSNEKQFESYKKGNVEFDINHYVEAAGYLITINNL